MGLTFSPTMRSGPGLARPGRGVPAAALRVGAVHRARVRMMDNTGRWSRWSAPLEFVAGPPSQPLAQQGQLRLTEIHFHPAGDLHEEFVEIMNVGATEVDLSAVALTDGVRFRFADGAVRTLGPGERVVIVENLDDFRARYGAGIQVAGVFRDRLSNGGEKLTLTFGQNVLIQSFSYKDSWQPRADGGGRSLEIIDPRGAVESWSQAAAWRASAVDGGTPGR